MAERFLLLQRTMSSFRAAASIAPTGGRSIRRYGRFMHIQIAAAVLILLSEPTFQFSTPMFRIESSSRVLTVSLNNRNGIASRLPRIHRTIRQHVNPEMTLSPDKQQVQPRESKLAKTTKWPDAEDDCDTVHVRFVTKVEKGVYKTPVAKVAKKNYDIFVNDTQKRPAATGCTPLSIGKAAGGKSENHFTVLGDLAVECPSYLHFLPPVAGDAVSRLWVTQFGMARAGGVVGVDLTGNLPARRCKAPFVWPNAVEHVKDGELSGVKGASILVADGFLVPGKNDGCVWVVEDPGGPNERAVAVTPRKKTWFYHKAVPFEMNGHQGILTARAFKSMNPFVPASGELVWLEKPATLDPMAEWNVPWREVVLASGPDVMFEVVDLDPSDSTIEVFAAEFFSQKLTLHSLAWDERERRPQVVGRSVLDDTLGQAYGVILADLEGENSHLLVTTHEDLQVNEGGSGLSLIQGRQPWSYTKIPTPKDFRQISEQEDVVGGSLFAYTVPKRWRQEEKGTKKREAFKQRLEELYRRLDLAGEGVREDDLQAAMVSMGVDISAEEVSKMFSEADWDESGWLDYAEFERLMLGARDSSASPMSLLARALTTALEIPTNAVRELESKVPSASGAEEDFQRELPEAFKMMDADGSGSIDMVEMKGAMNSMGVSCTDVELAAMFVEADSNRDGSIDWPEFQALMLGIYKSSHDGGDNVWSKALSSLEKALSMTSTFMERDAVVWRRRTLASGFRVKRVGINPGAPGFVYPFHPHKALKDAGKPPHLLLAGDCADAAYVYRPVRRSEEGELNYELMATFGCEGTVGSVGIGWGDTVQSVDDGWAKFFVPVYEADRVYMMKCGEPPEQGYTPDDEW